MLDGRCGDPTCSCGALDAVDVGQLTARELEVFELLGRGFSNAEIARKLVVSGSTVKAHLGRIVLKTVGANVNGNSCWDWNQDIRTGAVGWSSELYLTQGVNQYSHC